MEVPADYVFDQFNTRIDDLKEHITMQFDNIANELVDCKKNCRGEIQDHEDRIKEMEKLKYKVLAFAAVGSFIASLIFLLI